MYKIDFSEAGSIQGWGTLVNHDPDLGTIELNTGVPGYTYQIDLDRCQTSKACLDWIHQVNAKTWATPELMKGFITCLFDVIPGQLWHG